MHTVEMIEQALGIAEQMGYSIRHEWLGTGGGACEFGGRKWLFVDLALTAEEQLDQITNALRPETDPHQAPVSPAVQRLPNVRRAA